MGVFMINAGLCVPCLAIAFILKDIVITDRMKKENDRNDDTDENKGDDEDEKGCSGIIKEFLKNTFRIPVLKDKTFWITIVVFFFFSFGTSLPTFSLPEISSQMQEQLAPPVDSFYEVLSANVGTLLGLILTYLLKSLPCVERYRNRKRNMGFVFCIITLSGYIMAILSLVTQENFVYYIIYILVLTIFEVLTENFRDESMPSAFGRFNIRLTQGFLQMSVGLGGLSASAFQNGIDKADNDGGWKLNFRLGGGFLLISGSITGVVLAFDFISKRTFLRHSCFVNILTDGTITKRKPAPAKTGSKCCTYMCCIKYQTKTEKEDEKPAECTDCCDGCTDFNCPRCLTLPCCLKKRPNDRTEEQSCALPCACCKGFSLSCLSICCLPKKQQNENKDTKQTKCDFNCCKAFSPTCIPKCSSIACLSKKRSESEKNEKAQTDIVCKGCSLPSFRNCFKLPCSSKKRLKSQSGASQQTSRKEPLCSSKCISMPCLARKESYSEHDEEVRNSTENEGRSPGFPKCLKFPCTSKEQPKSQNKPKQHRPRKELSCTPKCFSIPCVVRKRSNSNVDEEARDSTEQENKGCTPPSFPKCLDFSCTPKKRQKFEDDTKVNETRKELKSVSGTETKRQKRIFPLSCCLNFQIPACLPSKKPRSVLSQSIESDIETEHNNQNVPDPVNDEYKQSKSKCKGFTLSKCFKFPTKQQSSPEINTSLQGSIDHETAIGYESNIESEPKRSVSKPLTFSNCFKFRNIQCLIPKSSSEMSSSDSNSTVRQSSLQDKIESSTSELGLNESKYRGSMLQNMQCFSQESLSSENQTAPTRIEDHIEESPKQDKSACKGMTLLCCGAFPIKDDMSSYESNLDNVTSTDRTALQNDTKQDEMAKEEEDENVPEVENSKRTITYHSEHKSSFNCFHAILCQSIPNKVTPTSNQSDSVYSSAKTPGPSSIETSQNLNIQPSSSKNDDKFTQSKTPDPPAMSDSTTKCSLFNCCPQFQKKHVYLNFSETSSLSKQQSNQKNTETDIETLSSNNDTSETRPGKVSTPKPNSESEQVNKDNSGDKENDNTSVDEDNKNKSGDKDNNNKSVDKDNKNTSGDKENKSVDGDDKNKFGDKDKDRKYVDGDNKNGSGDIDDKSKSEDENQDLPSDTEQNNLTLDESDLSEKESPDTENEKAPTTNPSKGNGDKKEPEPDLTDDPFLFCQRLERAKAPPTKPIYRTKRLQYEASRIKRMSQKSEKILKSQEVSQSADKITDQNPKSLHGKNSEGLLDDNTKHYAVDESEYERSPMKKMSQEDEKPIKTREGSQSADETLKEQPDDIEDEMIADCQRYERALAPPYKHISLNRRLQYEAKRTKANNE
ncbi:protein SCAF11-like isoform X2 [Ruditapes philippinarum]|uniref:protein SCAF11-like isoform X2 n=1 Tax=Ruditapes philippinarum TaxID=129788 RepID=UPI00295BD123|nr:protein SCAF11-like isoform X2 [Ruditapes philippinarum]